MWRKKIPWSSQIKQSQQDSIPPSTPLPPTQTQKKEESKQQDTTIKCKTANFKNVKLQCNTTVGKKIIIIIKKKLWNIDSQVRCHSYYENQVRKKTN